MAIRYMDLEWNIFKYNEVWRFLTEKESDRHRDKKYTLVQCENNGLVEKILILILDCQTFPKLSSWTKKVILAHILCHTGTHLH
jgi:hypothetical protein